MKIVCLAIFIYLISCIIYYIKEYYGHLNGSYYFKEAGNTFEFKTLPRLTFKQFLSFYNINPEKWCIMNEEGWYYHPIRIYEYNGQPIAFKTIFDYIKYVKWIKKQCKNQNEKKRNEKLQIIVDDVKKDINKINKDYENILTESTKTYLQVATRLKDDMKYYVDINEVNNIDTSKLYKGEPICIINSLTGKRKHYIWDGENFIFVKIF